MMRYAKYAKIIYQDKSLLVPKYKIKNVSQISKVPQLMADDKIIYIFDKDDTLVPLHQFQVRDQKISKTLQTLYSKNKKIMIVSNSVKASCPPVSYLTTVGNRQIKVSHCNEKKPFNQEQIHGFVAPFLKSNPDSDRSQKNKNSSVVMVGDRLLTDILLGNLMGFTTVLVEPIEQTTIKKHGLGVWIMRRIENGLIKLLTN